MALAPLALPAAGPAAASSPLAAPVVQVTPLALPPAPATAEAAPPPAITPAAFTALDDVPLAERPRVVVRGGQHAAFERIVFDWPAPVTYRLVREGSRVAIAFDRPARFALDGLIGDVETLIFAAAASPDGRQLQLEIAAGAELRSFAYGQQIVLDVLRPSRQLAAVTRDAPTALPAAAPARAPSPPVKQADAATSPAITAVAAATAEPGRPAEDAFEVDDATIDRALERTLVDIGALLLAPGQIEVAPSFAYTRQVSSNPAVLALFAPTQPTPLPIAVVQGETRRNEFTANLPVRLGLPFDSQLELSLPYRLVDQTFVASSAQTPARAASQSGHGVGDLRVSLAKGLWHEDGGLMPDLIGRVSWDSDFGNDSDNGVGLGGGFTELGGSLTALKRQDPLAFFATASYETTLEKDQIDPGDEVGVSLGTALAASPDTSLRLGLDQRFVRKTKLAGQAIDGSEQVAASLNLGASSVLGRGVLLNAAVDVGLTDDAPDYAVSLSLPIRLERLSRWLTRPAAPPGADGQ